MGMLWKKGLVIMLAYLVKLLVGWFFSGYIIANPNLKISHLVG